MGRITRSAPIIMTIALMSALTALAGPADRPVGRYGRLYAAGNRLLGKRSGGDTVQLKEPSLQWSVVGWGRRWSGYPLASHTSTSRVTEVDKKMTMLSVRINLY